MTHTPSAAEIFQGSFGADEGNVLVRLEFNDWTKETTNVIEGHHQAFTRGEMLISCKPCALRKQQLFACVVLNTLEHGICQFCGGEN